MCLELKDFNMSRLTKLLPMLVLLLCAGPFATQAQAQAAQHGHGVHATPKSWATNFGFLPVDNKASHCTEAQTGFWPRPLHCKH